MDFDFTEEQEQLRDATRRWVTKAYDFERRKRIVKSGGFDAQAWGELAELGLFGLNVPDEHGGLGLGPVESMVVMEELGRGLVLEPYAAVAVIATGLLRWHAPEALRSAWLPRLVAGQARVVLAHQEREARYELQRVGARAVKQGAAYALTAAKSLVPVGDQADAFLVSARLSGDVADRDGIGIFLVERQAGGVQARAYGLQDGSRAAEVSFKDSPATLVCDGSQGLAALEQAVDAGIAALCAEAVGVMDRLFAITVDYLNTRKQFGVPIGTFQALRHRVADMKMQLELARSMSYFATLKLGEPAPERRRALSMAKVQLGQSMRFVGQQAVQLHGGIGVTDEYIASHYFKRLTCMEMTFGDTLHHLGEVSARMEDTAGVFA